MLQVLWRVIERGNEESKPVSALSTTLKLLIDGDGGEAN